MDFIVDSPAIASLVTGAGPHRGKDVIQSNEHRSSSYEKLLITGEADAAAQKRSLRIQLTGGYRNSGIPILLKPDVFWLGRPRTKCGTVARYLQMVDDSAFGAVGHYLSDANPVIRAQFGHRGTLYYFGA
jgi:hypothetical protein